MDIKKRSVKIKVLQDFIENIEIEHFKSLRQVKIAGCKRLNLFIGRPNVGKSNLLEALSLFSIPYLRENSNKKLSNLIRLQNEMELFYNGNTDVDTKVSTNIGNCQLGYHPKEGLLADIDFFGTSYHHIRIDDKLQVKGLRSDNLFEPRIKRYNFKTDVHYKKAHAKYLIPPYGFNLLSIIEQYPDLKKDVISLFGDYDLEIAFDKSSQTINIIHSDKKGIFLIPYNSIADTLQRILFFKSAISSNNDGILLLEDPEAHSFPPYMSHITQEMIYKKDNQFFVATHSPFILNDLLENGRKELAVFIVHYEDHETKIKLLTDNQLHDVFQNGIDLFTNNENFF